MVLGSVLLSGLLIAQAPDARPPESHETWLALSRSFERNFNYEWSREQRYFHDIGAALSDETKRFSSGWKEMEREQERTGRDLAQIARLLSGATKAPPPADLRVAAVSLESLRLLSRSIEAAVQTMEREARAAQTVPLSNARTAPMRLWEITIDHAVNLLANLDSACRNYQAAYESELSTR